MASASPAVIFLSVLDAAFTDERALIASAGTLLFWLRDTRPLRGRQTAAVMAAWLAYLGLRFYLARACGLSTGHTGLFRPLFLYYHLTVSIPYRVVTVFEGLWLWLLLGGMALAAGRRWLVFVAYAGVFTLLSGLAFAAVFDLERTLGYLVILFPAAWRAGGLLPANALFAARLVFLLNLVLICPWETPLHFLSYFLHQHPW